MENNKSKLTNLKLSDISDKIPAFYVLGIDAIANQMIKDGHDILKLNLGKSEVQMPKYVIDEMVDKLYDNIQREIIDSQGLFLLREEIANDYNTTYKTNITAKQVFINNGTSPFFSALCLLLVNPGEEILFPKPYYPTYVASANIARADSRFYNIVNGRIDLESFKEQFTPGKTKIVFLNSPGNPYGNVVSKEELKSILDIVAGQAYVISDEIYDGFVYNDNFASIFDVYDPQRDSVVVINGFSKIHHMYTRRLGYAIVPESLIPILLKLQQHTVVCVDPITQFGGLMSIKNKTKLLQEEIKQEVAEYKNRLNICEEYINSTRLKLIRPDGSFYMCVDVSQYLNEQYPNSLALAEKILNDIKVAVTPGEDFGRNDFFRISLTSSRVVEGVKKITDYLRSY